MPSLRVPQAPNLRITYRLIFWGYCILSLTDKFRDVYKRQDLSVVAKFGEVRAFTRAAVADGYTVQNDEWLVISSDGSQ